MNDSDLNNNSESNVNSMIDQQVSSSTVHIIENDNTEIVHHDTGHITTSIGQEDDIDNDRPITTTTPLPMDVTTTTPASKRMYLLSLVQMYQNIYTKYIIPLYKSMIWNITVSCRTIQSRSSSSHHLTSTTTSALSALHIPMQRTFVAQRRIYYNNISNNATDSSSRTNISDTSSSLTPVLCECDENGISITTNNDTVISMTQQSSDAYPLDNNEVVPALHEEDINDNDYDIDPSATTGLRQRKGQQQASKRTSTSVSMEQSNNEKQNRLVEHDVDQQQHEIQMSQNNEQQQQYMIQLLLRSSNNGLLSKAPISLLHAQNDSIQLLQYISTILIHLQILIQKEISSTTKE
jgi:hypothetical protein